MATFTDLQTINKTVEAFEQALQKKDGGIIWTSVNSTIVYDKEGKHNLFYGIFRDITERKKAEETLRENEDRYRGLYESSKDGIASAAIDGHFLECNQAFADMLGYTKEEVYNLSFRDITPSKWHDSDAKLYIEQMIPRGYSDEYEKEFTRKDGTIFPVSLRGWFIEDREGARIGTWAIVHDITERKQAEESLQKSENKYRTLLETAGLSIAYWDTKGVLLLINNLGASQLSEQPKDLIGKSIQEILGEEKGDYYLKRMNAVANSGISQSYEDTVTLPSGISSFISTYSAVTDTNDQVIGIQAIANDITERKQTEDKVRWLAEFPSENPNPVLRIAKDGTILYANPASLTLLSTWNSQVGNLLPEPWYKYVADVLHHGSPKVVDVKCEKQLISLTFAPVVDREYVNLYGLDVTERKQAESALRESEKNFRNSLDNSPMGISIVDTLGEIIHTNQAHLDIWGYSSLEELKSIPPEARYATQTQPEAKRRLKRRRLGKSITNDFQVDIVRKDGEIRHLESFTHEILWNGKRRYQILYRDITERKQAEEEKRVYIAGIDNASDGIVFTGMKGDILYFNNSACRIFGYSSAEMRKMNISTFSATSADRKILEESMGEKREFFGEIMGLRKNRETFPAILSVSIVNDDKGDPISRMGVFRDTTERKQAEEREKQLQQELNLANRLATVGEMAAGIAHEINNPLTGVVGFSDLLLKKDLPEDIRKDVDIIHEGARRIADITQRMLSFARQHKPERTSVNINEIIEATLAMRAYEMESSNIKVTTELATDIPLTFADAGQLQQVFLNIILNAEMEMNLVYGKGNLLVKTERIDNTIKVSFEDDGSGIPKKNIDRLFDPFFTTRDPDKGTGLGLSICYTIVTQHGGKIYARSRLGKGATFFVELPIVTKEEQLKMAEPAAEVSKTLSRARVLVVDDDTIVQQLLSEVLDEEGYEVEIVENGDDALERINSKDYDVILLDIKLPGMSGIKLYEYMQTSIKSLIRKVIFITGDVMSADTMVFIKSAHVPHITKPFDAEQLKKEITKITSL